MCCAEWHVTQEEGRKLRMREHNRRVDTVAFRALAVAGVAWALLWELRWRHYNHS